ncbi:MAG TPA: SpoIVB peptidase [Candidatus Choladousia intestinigallinarum]|nr:SpoIVB peptidase [Candidatus Choladousia intestinigallinarum]
MSGRKKYKRFVRTMLLFGVMALLYSGWLLMRGQIPDSMQVAGAAEIPSFFPSPLDTLIQEEVILKQAAPESSAEKSQTELPDGKLAASVSTGNVNGSYQISYSIFGKIPLKTVSVEVVEREKVYAGGIPIGIYLETNGVLVVGTGSVESVDGKSCIPAENLVMAGDYITAANGTPLNTKEELVACINQSQGHNVLLDVQRGGKLLQLQVTPVQTGDGEYKAGIWVRNDTQGIGTLTYVDQEGNFGALGHGISDVDTGSLMEISDGLLYNAEVVSIIKGAQGQPGELAGVIHYSDGYRIGQITENTKKGIYGTITGFPLLAEHLDLYEIGYRQEVETGPAVIISMVDGVRKEFDIEIQELRYNVKEENKGMILKVTDDELLELTGGIVQGMSGSPIIQNGRLIGAVTHVFVNDPTKGYGIFIENMLD